MTERNGLIRRHAFRFRLSAFHKLARNESNEHEHQITPGSFPYDTNTNSF
jgi:hypothetical protein